MSIVELIKKEYGIVVTVAEKAGLFVYSVGEKIVATFSKAAHGAMPASKIAAHVADGARLERTNKPVEPVPAAKAAAKPV